MVKKKRHTLKKIKKERILRRTAIVIGEKSHRFRRKSLSVIKGITIDESVID